MRLLRRSLALRILIGCVVVVPFAESIAALWSGTSGSSIVVGVIVAAALPAARQRARLRLNRGDRRIVDDVIETGLPSGRSELDEIARDQLATYAAWSASRADRIFTAIFGSLLVIVPVIAALVRSPWWLLALVPTPLVFLLRRATPDVPAEERLRILLGSSSAHGDAERGS